MPEHVERFKKQQICSEIILFGNKDERSCAFSNWIVSLFRQWLIIKKKHIAEQEWIALSLISEWNYLLVTGQLIEKWFGKCSMHHNNLSIFKRDHNSYE